MKDVTVVLDEVEITRILKDMVAGFVKKSLDENREQIEKSISGYFSKGVFLNKESLFESGLDWAVENCFRLGLNQALEEMDFKSLVAAKAKEILSDDGFIRVLAEKKVRASLGLPME